MTEEQIHLICEEYNITNYTINDDMSIDVNGIVNLYNKNLKKIPLKFRKVSGLFNCTRNSLTNLKGSPIEVGGYFICTNNKLTTLEDGPKFIGGSFYCYDNPIYKEFRDKFNLDYNLYLKYIKRQKILKQLIND